MVEVFKTNVQEAEEEIILLDVLLKHFPEHKINFDLSDCDNILRIEGSNISYREIIEIMKANNYRCEVLE
jgi:hypothetical protein